MGFLRWNKPISSSRIVPPIVFWLILALAAYLRFSGLGGQSLWVDEFCTWKVAEMPLPESLLWQPELTKPPLYQIAVRGVGALNEKAEIFEGQPSPRPSPQGNGGVGPQDAPYAGQDFAVQDHAVPDEWHLRLPAAVCGLLAVAAIWWLGAIAGGWMIGASAALLFAVNALQIDYSRMARPYSMLVLGSIVSTGLWHRLNYEIQNSEFKVQRLQATWLAIGYILVTAITFHANYLIGLTVAAHAVWAAVFFVSINDRQLRIDKLKACAITMLAAVAACVPITWHFLRHRTSVFQGLDWIASPIVGDATKVLGEITFGPIWVAGLCAAGIVCLFEWFRGRNKAMSQQGNAGAGTFSHHPMATSPIWSIRSLLLVWLAMAWGGLLVISWVAHPVLVARYALPAAAPAILLPLFILHRWDRRLPLLVAGAFVVGTAPTWATRVDRVKPGFREMVQFLDEYADPQHEAVVVAIERTTSPGWEEMDLLGFEYYQSSKFKVQSSKRGKKAARQEGNEEKYNGLRAAIEVLYLRHGRPDGDQPILRDPRALWMVTFLADPMEAIESAGRRVEQIEIGDKVLDQLYFDPYRLIRVARRE